jgi:hypothetical protein
LTPNRNRRLPQDDIQEDRHALIGVQSLLDYAPMSSAHSVVTLVDLRHAMDETQQAEVRAVQALVAARDAAAAAEWAFHEGMLGAKAQVIAQYGPDAPVVQLLGLKRKIDRRRPARRAALPL